MSKVKVLITHAVPVNNGDAALVIALYQSLLSKGYDVHIATYYFARAKKIYPHLPFIKELADYYFLRKLPFLKPIFMRLNFLVRRRQFMLRLLGPLVRMMKWCLKIPRLLLI